MPPYDSPRHHRRSIRLQRYDYTQPGVYFVTICTHDRACSFGEVADGQMQSNHWGRIVAECWTAIPTHFAHVVLDEWVVMPNHVHGILVITDSASTVGATQWFAPTSAAPTTPASPSGPLPGSIGAIVGQFKSIVTKRINLLRGITAPPVWQRNYYEHIVRNETALNAIRQYIRQNPVKWALDRDNDAIGQPMA